MQARGPDYTLVRRVAFGPRKIDVADEITNSSPDAALGLRVIHSVSLQGHDDPVVRLAGNPDPAVNEYYSPTNPSVSLVAKSSPRARASSGREGGPQPGVYSRATTAVTVNMPRPSRRGAARIISGVRVTISTPIPGRS